MRQKLVRVDSRQQRRLIDGWRKRAVTSTALLIGALRGVPRRALDRNLDTGSAHRRKGRMRLVRKGVELGRPRMALRTSSLTSSFCQGLTVRSAFCTARKRTSTDLTTRLSCPTSSRRRSENSGVRGEPFARSSGTSSRPGSWVQYS